MDEDGFWLISQVQVCFTQGRLWYSQDWTRYSQGQSCFAQDHLDNSRSLGFSQVQVCFTQDRCGIRKIGPGIRKVNPVSRKITWIIVDFGFLASLGVFCARSMMLFARLDPVFARSILLAQDPTHLSQLYGVCRFS